MSFPTTYVCMSNERATTKRLPLPRRSERHEQNCTQSLSCVPKRSRRALRNTTTEAVVRNKASWRLYGVTSAELRFASTTRKDLERLQFHIDFYFLFWMCLETKATWLHSYQNWRNTLRKHNGGFYSRQVVREVAGSQSALLRASWF